MIKLMREESTGGGDGRNGRTLKLKCMRAGRTRRIWRIWRFFKSDWTTAKPETFLGSRPRIKNYILLLSPLTLLISPLSLTTDQ